MLKDEIAQNITLKALEMHLIALDDCRYDTEETITKANTFNAKQISDFYNAIHSQIILS